MNGGAFITSRVLRVAVTTTVTSLVTPFAFSQESDGFGASVGISGDYAVVGALPEGKERGAAYIFRRTGNNSWDIGRKLVAPPWPTLVCAAEQTEVSSST